MGFFRGMLGVVSIPAAILMTSIFGFGVLCRESGLSLGHAVVMTGAIWALPSQVVLTGSIVAGSSLPAAALAVTLSAIRLMPMTAAWVPVVRDPGGRRWKVLLLAHFVAVTSWVWAFMKLPSVPRAGRLTYFAGFAVTLSALNIAMTAISYELAGTMPPMLAGSLFFLTPIYFVTALSAAARHLAERLAMPIGIVLGPVFFHLQVGLDLVWAGLIGGTVSYLVDYLARARRRV